MSTRVATSMQQVAARLRELSSFGGDAAAAFCSLYADVARALPGCTVVLLVAPPPTGGPMRLGGTVRRDGTAELPADNPFDARAELPRVVGPLVQRLLGCADAPLPHLLEGLSGSDAVAQLVGAPHALALPLFGDGTVRYWLLVSTPDKAALAAIDLDRLWRDVTLAYVTLDRQLLSRSLLRETDRHHDELSGLAEVQRLLQPDQPTIRRMAHAVHWQPAALAAGDYYDVMPLTYLAGPEYEPQHGDVWGAMIADVSGHGAIAAMEAVQFDAILRTYQGNEPPGGPAGVLTYANRYFFSRRRRRHFLTAFACVHHPERGELVYVNAGHPPALLLHEGTVTRLGDGDGGDGIPLGVVREHQWRNQTAPFGPGDVLVLYTDGIVEARNAAGEAFGIEGIERRLKAMPPDPTAMLSRLRLALIAHQGGDVGADDQTLIVLLQR
jgi:sigma-B regulation protein RsbU (phosphoserine phosphatase)